MLLALGGASILLLSACAGSPPTPQATADPGGLEEMEPVVLRVSEIGPENGAPGRGLQAFMDYAREHSEGKIDFEPYYSATLAPPAESLAAIKSGLTDIGFFGATFNPQELPISYWGTNVARDVIGPGHPESTVVGSAATNALYQTSPELLAEFAESNMVPLAVVHSGPFPMLCTEPVESTEQAQGKVVATFGSPWKEEVEALGMTNVSLPPPELYEALQRGIVDCVSSAANNHVNLGLMEEAKYLTLIDGAAGSGSGYAINKEVWDGLPPAAQRILVEAKASFVRGYVSETLSIFSKLISEAKRLGVTILDPTGLNATIHKQSDAVAAGLPASAPATLTDPQAFIEPLEGYRDHWSDLAADELGLQAVPDDDIDGLVKAFSDSKDAVDFDDYETAMREYFGDLFNKKSGE
ncbi:TRAP transporter substrate-binding protein DctP [Salinibacterium sp. ZJ450]|uniref:TRAP transporter substrate-binding protein DctP n=1 Tax=Salinibacterium sp. ZJ450 TaxID=2708338 RepID=UPI0014222683|nr:TRAP transporter substrate-binding protein DctP [Salinibacterium sp. ZJ450]